MPTCFRHPGRETYVSCVRCGRPACPDCLRSAAVGQQCVECIRQASRTTRRPAGAFGGQLTSGATVTWTLDRSDVGFYDNSGRFVVEPGDIDVYAGDSSSASDLTGSFTVTAR